jgi:hypothetical protein
MRKRRFSRFRSVPLSLEKTIHSKKLPADMRALIDPEAPVPPGANILEALRRLAKFFQYYPSPDDAEAYLKVALGAYDKHLPAAVRTACRTALRRSFAKIARDLIPKAPEGRPLKLSPDEERLIPRALRDLQAFFRSREHWPTLAKILDDDNQLTGAGRTLMQKLNERIAQTFPGRGVSPDQMEQLCTAEHHRSPLAKAALGLAVGISPSLIEKISRRSRQ